MHRFERMTVCPGFSSRLFHTISLEERQRSNTETAQAAVNPHTKERRQGTDDLKETWLGMQQISGGGGDYRRRGTRLHDSGLWGHSLSLPIAWEARDLKRVGEAFIGIPWERLRRMDVSTAALISGQLPDPVAILDRSDSYDALEWIRIRGQRKRTAAPT